MIGDILQFPLFPQAATEGAPTQPNARIPPKVPLSQLRDRLPLDVLEHKSTDAVSAEEFSELPDSLARRQALDIHASWVVEAPAGAGKTGLLIQRLLKLLAFADIASPAEVLAITFTRKAAQEMRTRVLEQLIAAANATHPLNPQAGVFERTCRRLADVVLERDRTLGWHLLDSPQQLNIRTIDSFCGEVARSMPMLAGGVAHHKPIDAAQPLYEEAAGRVLRALGGLDRTLDRSLQTLLLHREWRVEDCVALIAGMLAEREQWGDLIPLTPGEAEESCSNLSSS